jgi:integrase
MKKGLGWWTLKDLKFILSGIFTKAKQWGYLDKTLENPVSGTEVGRKRCKRKRRILTDGECRQLLAILPALIQLMVMTAVSTGLRESEVLGLKWGAVDLARGWVMVTERYSRGDTDIPKSDESERSVPLGELLEVFRRFKPVEAKPEDYVFSKGSEPFDDRDILKKYIRPAAKRLGIYFLGFGWHSFRRQNLTRIQEEGASPVDAQVQAGHSRPGMTQEYPIITEKKRLQAVRRFQKKLLAKRTDWSPEGGFAGIVRNA